MAMGADSSSSSSGSMNRSRTRKSMPSSTSAKKRSLIHRRITNRSASCPPPSRTHRVVPGIMVVSTLEESLHSRYGSLRHSDGFDQPAADLSDSQRLKFADLQIREYARQVGDNPSVSAGPPLSLGWDYNDAQTISLDEYESQRGPRRSSPEMAVPRSIRDEMLRREWEVPRSDIAQAVREVVKTKNQRRTTVQNMDKFARAEEVAQSAKRKLKRFLLRTKRDSAMYEEWVSEAERARAMIAEEDAAAKADDDGGAPPPSSLDVSARRGEAKSLRAKKTVIVSREAEAADDVVDTNLARDPAIEMAPRRPSGVKIAPSLSAHPQKLIICSEEDAPEVKVLPREQMQVPEQTSGVPTYEVYDPMNVSLRASCA